jgi:hypothetical protein
MILEISWSNYEYKRVRNVVTSKGFQVGVECK